MAAESCSSTPLSPTHSEGDFDPSFADPYSKQFMDFFAVIYEATPASRPETCVIVAHRVATVPYHAEARPPAAQPSPAPVLATNFSEFFNQGSINSFAAKYGPPQRSRSVTEPAAHRGATRQLAQPSYASPIFPRAREQRVMASASPPPPPPPPPARRAPSAEPVAHGGATGQPVAPQGPENPAYGHGSEDALPASLNGLVDYQTYLHYLRRLCRHNMDCKPCRYPSCLRRHKVFTCPAFVKGECTEPFHHIGFIHTTGCGRFGGEKDCRKPGCREYATLVHIRGFCVQRKNHQPCFKGMACDKGHDHAGIRRHIIQRLKDDAKRLGQFNRAPGFIPPYSARRPPPLKEVTPMTFSQFLAHFPDPQPNPTIARRGATVPPPNPPTPAATIAHCGAIVVAPVAPTTTIRPPPGDAQSLQGWHTFAAKEYKESKGRY